MKTTGMLRILFLAPLTLLLVTGCVGTAPLRPVAGWRSAFSQDSNLLPKAIVDDYKGYIEELSPKERRGFGGIHIFEDGKGQHAVTIAVDMKHCGFGTEWTHVLIYDKSDKRIKRVKYRSGHFMS